MHTNKIPYNRVILRNSLLILLVGISIIFSRTSLAITITDANTAGVTPATMAAALQGNGVTISNLTITSVPGCNSRAGVGLFTQGTTPTGPGPVLSEPTGVVVANGAINNAANPLDSSNNAPNVSNTLCNAAVSDPDMVALEPGTAQGEYSAIEFDVVPQAGTLAIPFQFGSEEFPEYVCSQYGDVVGIFVSGPGINGPYSGALKAQNYAKTAGGDPSSINWVNTGTVGQFGNVANCGSLGNAAFYTDNSNGNALGGNNTVATTNANLELDGFTNTLYQPITVVPGQTYHVKIAVADSGDLLYESAAFIHPVFSSGNFSGFDFGDAPDSYRTLASSGGPSHGIDSAIFMGNNGPDSEVTGQPSVNADGDDLNGIDDEDGVSTFPVLTTSATSYSVTVKVTNTTGTTATLVGWIDFNKNGRFDATEGTTTLVPTGISGGNVTLTWSGLTGLVAGNTYVRLRFSTDSNLSTLTPGSTMFNGEVEDYPLTIQRVIFTKYASTNSTCNDRLTAITVATGSNVYFCYTVTNPNPISFTISPGNTTDSQGHNISALEQNYPPSATKTVIIGPILAGSGQLPDGTTTINIAQVTASFGSANATSTASASVIVTSNPPASGIKQLYLDNLNTTSRLTRIVPTNNTRTGDINGGASVSINQQPVFQAAFVITGGSTLNVKLWLRNRGGGGNRRARMDLYNGNTGVLIGSNSQTWTGRRYITFPVSIAAKQSFAVGDFFRMTLTNTSPNGKRIRLNTLRNGNISQLQIQTATVINVDTIGIYSAAYPSTTRFSSYKPGSNVFIRASVSDPFGNADISKASIQITDPTATVRVNNAVMTSVATPNGASRIFEYQYTLPASPQGFWKLKVTADEGSEGLISHTAQATMIVGLANITINKSSIVLSDPVNTSMPKAIPDSIIEYTIRLQNSGFGYVDKNSVIITDPLVPSTQFFFGKPLNPITFIDGSTPSGLNVTFAGLGSTTDDIDFSNDGGATFITPQVDTNGFDITAPPINFIRIKPKGEFIGSDGINHPSMKIKFRVRVK